MSKRHKNSDLSVLAYANNFTFWHYTGKDDGHTLEDIAATDYFVQAVDMLREGDLIVINAADANGSAWVMENDGSSVVIQIAGETPTPLGGNNV